MKGKTIHLYLGEELKTEWLSYCELNKIKPGCLLREMIELKIKENLPNKKSGNNLEVENISDRKKIRVQMRINAELHDAINGLINTHTETVQTWIIETIRSRLKEEKAVTHSDIHSLTESNAHLRSVGVNLNQIARVLNTNPSAKVTLEQIQKVSSLLNAHIDRVNEFVRERMQKRADR